MALPRSRYPLCCALLLALFASLWLLASLDKPLWRDEMVTLFAARAPLARAFAIARADHQGWLFVPLLHFWIRLAGDDPERLRALPLLFSLATVALLQRAARPWLCSDQPGRGLGEQATALLALAALSLNPVVFFYSFELRSYAVYLFFTAALFVAAARVLDGERRWWPALLAAALGALCANALGVLWVASVVAVLLASAAWRRQWRAVALLSLGALAAGLALLPVLREMLHHASALHRDSCIQFHGLATLDEAQGIFAPWDQLVRDPRPIALLAWLGLALSALGLLDARAAPPRSRERSLALAALPAPLFAAGLYLASLSLAPVFFRRYLACAAPAVAALSLLGYRHRWLARPWLRAPLIAVHALAAVLLLANLIRGVGEVDYRRLAALRAPIFTPEADDLLPCVGQSARCSYVGNPADIRACYGYRYFLEQIPAVEGWSALSLPEAYTLARPANLEALRGRLAAQGYRRVDSLPLGAGAALDHWAR